MRGLQPEKIPITCRLFGHEFVDEDFYDGSIGERCKHCGFYRSTNRNWNATFVDRDGNPRPDDELPGWAREMRDPSKRKTKSREA